MPKPSGRTPKRRGLLAIGLAAVACVGCCALPLLAAGTILGGGLTVIHDSCLAPLAIVLLVVVAAPAVWVHRRRKADGCSDGADCGCAPDAEANMVQSNIFRPEP